MTHPLAVYYFSGDNRGDEPVTVESESALDRVLADVLANEQPHPTVVYAKDRTTTGLADLPDHQIKFDADAEVGVAAIHAFGPHDFVDPTAASPQGNLAFVTKVEPTADVDVTLYIDKDTRTEFPKDSIIPLGKLRQALGEFLATGRRPTCVDWQETDVF